MNTPDWLRQHGGELKLGSDKTTWYVIIGGKPLYDLVTVPAGGKHSCVVRQTNNAYLIADKTTYASESDALQGGLDVLKGNLGWG